jgi:ATP-dependent Clp protease ATP-binding subunit ClpX
MPIPNAGLGNADASDDMMGRAEPVDLVSYGLIPEFVGRFPLIVSTSHLDAEQLAAVLTQPKNALLKQYRYMFGFDDVSDRNIGSCCTRKGLCADGL